MRTLSVKQKRMLDSWYSQYKGQFVCFIADETLTDEEYWAIYNVNQHECFDSNAERYIRDKVTQDLYGRK